MVKLSSKSLSLADSLKVSKILHCIGDYERISDHSVNIMYAGEELHQKNLNFSASAKADLRTMIAAIREIVDMTFDAFANNDLEKARQVEPLEQVIDLLNSQLRARHIARLQRGDCTTMLGFIFSDVITNFERVADHCSNIAVALIQIDEERFEAHDYMNTLKNSGDENFIRMYGEYKEKYRLT
jgi:phosphate:Na+ symporter